VARIIRKAARHSALPLPHPSWRHNLALAEKDSNQRRITAGEFWARLGA